MVLLAKLALASVADHSTASNGQAEGVAKDHPLGNSRSGGLTGQMPVRKRPSWKVVLPAGRRSLKIRGRAASRTGFSRRDSGPDRTA